MTSGAHTLYEGSKVQFNLRSEGGGIRNNEGRFPSRSFDFPLSESPLT